MRHLIISIVKYGPDTWFHSDLNQVRDSHTTATICEILTGFFCPNVIACRFLTYIGQISLGARSPAGRVSDVLKQIGVSDW